MILQLLCFSTCFRYACGISDDDDGSFIITGGSTEGNEITTLVSKYSDQGWIEDLPALKQARRRHGCGTYVDSNGSRVIITRIQNFYYDCSNFQIFLVTGGDAGQSNLPSTEMLEKNGDSWTFYENSLPRGLYSLKGVSVNNEVFVSGGSLMNVCLLIL